jgi:hypothetical protein
MRIHLSSSSTIPIKTLYNARTNARRFSYYHWLFLLGCPFEASFLLFVVMYRSYIVVEIESTSLRFSNFLYLGPGVVLQIYWKVLFPLFTKKSK